MKKIYSLILALSMMVSLQKTIAQVCTFTGQECCGEGITNFQLDGVPAINRTSTVNENSGFTNTGVTTGVVIGQTYTYSVTFPVEANIVNCNTYNFKIYIDYNHNDLLTDAGEEAASLSNVPTGTHTGTFTIPTSALTGNTYMRVMMKMAATSLSGGFCGHAPITPCNNPPDGIGFHGEVENYTLNITSSVGVAEQNVVRGFLVYPNPVSTNVSVSFYLDAPVTVSANIYNLLGKKISSVPETARAMGKHSLRLGIAEMNIADNGIYYIELIAGNKKTTGRFTVLR